MFMFFGLLYGIPDNNTFILKNINIVSALNITFTEI